MKLPTACCVPLTISQKTKNFSANVAAMKMNAVTSRTATIVTPPRSRRGGGRPVSLFWPGAKAYAFGTEPAAAGYTTGGRGGFIGGTFSATLAPSAFAMSVGTRIVTPRSLFMS